MLGGIVGAFVGQRFQGQTGPIDRDFKFWDTETTFGAEAVGIVAVQDALLDTDEESPKPDFDAGFRKWIAQYPDRGFDPAFVKWALDDTDTAPRPVLTDGTCLARAASVAAYVKTPADMTRLATAQALVSHGTDSAIEASVAVTGACFLAKQGAGRRVVRDWVEERFGYDLHTSYADLLANVPPADASAPEVARRGLICALWASGAEEAIRNAAALGGEAVTTCAVAGAAAQCLYYLELVNQNAALDRLETPLESVAMLFRAYT